MFPYTLIDGVRIYGKVIGPVTAEEVNHIQPTSASEFHIARHYTELPQDYKQTLISQTYEWYDTQTHTFYPETITQEILESALAMPGGHFLPEACRRFHFPTPRDLINLVKAQVSEQLRSNGIVWIERPAGNYAYITLTFPEPIGRSGVVSITDLPATRQHNVSASARGGKVKGDGFVVQKITGFPGPLVNQLSCTLAWLTGRSHPVVLTAYAGPRSPDFPDEATNNEERAYNQAFWDSHVFVS